ncbi:MAG: DUF6880 family protein [Alphaproteobacteria bacterium]
MRRAGGGGAGRAPKPPHTAKNLASRGAARLAALLMEIASGDAAAKRRLRMELAGQRSPGELAREVGKRLAAIAKARSYVDWQRRKGLVDDLEAQRRAIAGPIAAADPSGALDLMWRFLELADPVFARCDDRSGLVIGVFEAAVDDLAAIAAAAKADPAALADRVFRALCDNDDGQYDALIEALAPALGPQGLERLKQLFLELDRTPVPTPPQAQRRVVGFGSGGPIYADEIQASSRASAVRLALGAIADAQGDVDAYIAQQAGKAKTVPAVAAEIARRLLAAGRADEALSAIDAVHADRSGWIPVEWEEVRLDVLEALGRYDEAQAFRWDCFARSLNQVRLRAYLKRLPDFDDLAAEERALAHVLAFPEVHYALGFLVSWPALDKAAHLVLARAAEIDGNVYELLTPAAAALESAHPLAATVLRRAMIDFTLGQARSSRYRHAARHLLECAGLAAQIVDFGDLPAHDAYVARLRADHGRKSGFWSLVE